MIGQYYTADMTDEQFAANRKEAYALYIAGHSPNFSKGICDSVTAGYGRLDYYGYWEYPLIVDQKTLRVLPME